jgi:hypothetical protein
MGRKRRCCDDSASDDEKPLQLEHLEELDVLAPSGLEAIAPLPRYLPVR